MEFVLTGFYAVTYPFHSSLHKLHHQLDQFQGNGFAQQTLFVYVNYVK
jgi:hypothetical protein